MKYRSLSERLAEITSENRHEEVGLIEVTSEQASPDVIDMLANLSRRIVRLEDEIDTLHTNQKRLSEEVANLANQTAFDADEACGAIVELAKLLVESHRRESRMEAK